MSMSHQCQFPSYRVTNMNTICFNNCKISMNYNNGISYQSHYVSISFPRNVRALALKCQNIPQKLQVHNCFSQNKKRFWKKLQFRYQERSIWLSLPISNPYKSINVYWGGTKQRTISSVLLQSFSSHFKSVPPFLSILFCLNKKRQAFPVYGLKLREKLMI